MLEGIGRLISFFDYFGKIPMTFLLTIVCALGLILFLPIEIAKVLAIDKFRDTYRIFLGPAFLITVLFLIARICILIKQWYFEKRSLKQKQNILHKLTSEEKGYLVPYIKQGRNTVYVGIEDGIMNGLVAKGVIYRATSVGNIDEGFAFNLQSWAREYLENNPQLLDGHSGKPMTPLQKMNLKYHM